MTTFELVPDDEREDADLPGAPGSPDDHRPGRLAALRDRAVDRWRRLSRRAQVVAAASTAVVVLGATTAAVAPGMIDAHDQRQRAAAVRGLPGAVDDLSRPLDLSWELGRGGSTATVLADGTVVTTDIEDVVGSDPATGRERWRHAVGPSAQCGPPATLGFGRERAVDEAVVCVGRTTGGRTITTVDRSGEVLGTRTVHRGGEVIPAGDGTIAVVSAPAGTSVSVAAGSSQADRLRAVRDAGWRDAGLRLEDAVTGEPRGAETIALDDVDLSSCAYQEDEGSEEILELTPWTFTGEVTTMQVCDTAVAITSEGAGIRIGKGPVSWPTVLADGRIAVAGEESQVYDLSGALVATVPGAVVPPLVDDQPDGPLVAIGADRSGLEAAGRLTAVTDGGDVVWSSEVTALTAVVARVNGTLVLVDDDRIVGLDAATGAERWTRDDVLKSGTDGPGEYVYGAVTDGTRVLLATMPMAGPNRLVAVDLRDGTVPWTREVDGSPQRIAAAGGHPVLLGSEDAAAHGLDR